MKDCNPTRICIADQAIQDPVAQIALQKLKNEQLDRGSFDNDSVDSLTEALSLLDRNQDEWVDFKDFNLLKNSSGNFNLLSYQEFSALHRELAQHFPQLERESLPNELDPLFESSMTDLSRRFSKLGLLGCLALGLTLLVL